MNLWKGYHQEQTTWQHATLEQAGEDALKGLLRDNQWHVTATVCVAMKGKRHRGQQGTKWGHDIQKFVGSVGLANSTGVIKISGTGF